MGAGVGSPAAAAATDGRDRGDASAISAHLPSRCASAYGALLDAAALLAAPPPRPAPAPAAAASTAAAAAASPPRRLS